MNIRVKYCGGCNPQYDRVATVNMIQKRLRGKVNVVLDDSSAIDGVLLIVGCKTACVDTRPFADTRIWRIACVEDAEKVIADLKS